jgi:hypothetical protein
LYYSYFKLIFDHEKDRDQYANNFVYWLLGNNLDVN